MCSINIQGQYLLSVQHHYVLYSKRFFCCICWAFAFFSFGLGVANVVSTGWNRSQRVFFCLHHSILKREREVRASHLIELILCPMLWQTKCYLQPHCTGYVLPHTFHVEPGKSKMEIWPSARTSGNETSMKDSLIPKAVRCILYPHNWPHHSHGPVEILYCRLDLCCQRFPYFSLFVLSFLSAKAWVLKA